MEYILQYYPRDAKEAKEKGYKLYFTGRPCKHGHYSTRWTVGNKCCECQKGHSKNAANRRYRENKDDPAYQAKIKEYQKKTRANPKSKEREKAYRERNRERINAQNRKNKQKESYKQKEKEYRSSPQRRLAGNLRSRLRNVIKGKTKSGSSVKDLGCSLDFFLNYIESKWEDGMSWDNYGKGPKNWSLDHITPLSYFNLEDREQFLIANHFTNLQPMWHSENLRKGASLNYEV